MKAKSLVFAALAMVMAACVPTENPDPVDEFVPEFKVSGVKNNTISVGADKKDVTVSVTSNLSWSVTCQSDWVRIDPSSYTAKEDKTSEIVKVTVSVFENELEESRETELVFGAEGVDPVKVTVKQAAKEHVAPTIAVVDEDNGFEVVSGYSIDGPGLGGSVSFTVQATADWKVEAPDWVTVTPTSFTYSDNELALVTVSFGLNVTEAHSGELRFKGDFEADLVVPVSQAVAPSVSATLKSFDYRSAAFDIDAPEDMYWAWYACSDDFLAEYGVDGMVASLLYNLQGYATKWSAEGDTDAEILEGLADGKGATSGYTIEGMDGSTKYNFIFVPYSVKDAQVVLAGGSSEVVSFTTEVTPEASEAYAATIGTYVNNAYNYFASKKQDADVFTDLVMVVEPYYINESVLISFTGGDYFPDYGAPDKYVGKFIDGKIVVEPQLSKYGYRWDFGAFIGGIWFDPLYMGGKVTIENLSFTPSDGNLTISAYPESDVEDDIICLQSVIVTEGEDGAPVETGSAFGLAIFLDTTFAKQAEETPSSLSSAKTFVKKINKSFEKISNIYLAK